MKKIVYLSLLLIFLIPFSHSFANDTDLYILTQLMQQVPPDALVLLDLSGSMTNTPADSTTNALFYDPGTCTSWQYSCGNNVAYYASSASPNTSSCSSSTANAKYTSGSSACSTGPYYQSSGSGHTYKCTSGVPSTLYYNPGTCNTTYPYSCGNTTIPYYTTNASPNTTACTINSTQVIYGDPTCAGSSTNPFYMTYNATGSSASQTTCTQTKDAIAQRAIFKLLDADNCTGTGTPDGIINSCDQAYLKIRMGYMRYYGCGVYQTCRGSSN